MKIVIAGASGFIGRALVKALSDCELVALDRHENSQPGIKAVRWDGKSPGAWNQELEGATAVVNLSGAPATLKWTPENRRKILESRVESTGAIVNAIQAASNPPKVWINASAVGFYGDAKEAILTEQSPPGTGFLAEVCKQWEEAATQPNLPSVRRIQLRTGLPLGATGGALEPLRKLTKVGLGGSIGDGSQWWPWIHIEDLTAMVRWCIENEAMAGPINACSPEPVRNREFMKATRHALHRPWSPPAPKFALNLVGKLFGPDSEVLLASQRAIPKAALDGGFQWRYKTLDEALLQLLV